MSLQIQVRTEGLRVLRNQLGVELRQFDTEQRRQMKEATRLARFATRDEIRGGVIHRSGTLVGRGLRQRVRRVGPGQFEGTVSYTNRGFYGRFLELGVAHRKPGGTLYAREFMVAAMRQHEDDIVEILGDSFNVFTGR